MLFLKQKRFNLTTYYLLNAAELYKQFDRILILLCRRPPQRADGAIIHLNGQKNMPKRKQNYRLINIKKLLLK